MTTISEQLKQVKEKITKAVPDVYKPSFDLNIETYPITLEDVLIALSKKELREYDYFSVEVDGTIFLQDSDEYNPPHIQSSAKWQLGKPLDEQSPELIQFLFNNL